jgi:tetratricopeptide (TPR) repeat protein
MPSLRETHLRHAIYYESVLRAAEDLYEQGGNAILRGLALFDLEWLNIQTGQAWAAGHTGGVGDADEAAGLCSDYSGTGGYLLDLRQHPREQIRWREAGLAGARRLKDRRAEGVHLGNLGNAYAALGDARKAIEFYEKARAIAVEIGDRPNEGNWLGNLGLAYLRLGEKQKASEYLLGAQSLFADLSLPTPPAIIGGVNLLAMPGCLRFLFLGVGGLLRPFIARLGLHRLEQFVKDTYSDGAG